MTADDRDLLPAALLAAAEHDVRGQLNTLELGAGTLEAVLEGSDLQVAAAAVARSADRLAATLAELVTAAGEVLDGHPNEELVDVGALVMELADQAGLQHVHAPPVGRLLVVGNRVVLRHLVSNLVDNAVAASTAVQVQVHVHPGPGGTVEVEIWNPTSLSSVDQVASSGLLHTRRGRGLAIVRVLAASAGVEVQPEVGDGTYTVRLWLPGRVGHPSSSRPAVEDARVVALDAFRPTVSTDGGRPGS